MTADTVYVPSPGVPSAPALALARKGGYRRQPKTYRLRFEDEEYAGLDVHARSVSTGTLLDLTALASNAATDTAGRVGQVRELLAGFADALVSWNLEDEDGTPVPATLAGLQSQEFGFVFPIIAAWMDAISGVAGPLAPASPNGGTTLEASLPMAPLSPSPESWPEPS